MLALPSCSGSSSKNSGPVDAPDAGQPVYDVIAELSKPVTDLATGEVEDPLPDLLEASPEIPDPVQDSKGPGPDLLDVALELPDVAPDTPPELPDVAPDMLDTAPDIPPDLPDIGPDVADVGLDLSDVGLDLTETTPDLEEILPDFESTDSAEGFMEGWVVVPGGSFLMGSPLEEKCRSGNEGPQHEVEITRTLLVSDHELTYAEWGAVTGAPNPSKFGPNGSNKCDQDDCPVERINWWEALTYCNMLSVDEGLEPCYQLEGCSGSLGSGCQGGACPGDYQCEDAQFSGLDCEGYRLPTEAEWEYLARAGSSGAYAFPLPNGGTNVGACDSCVPEPNLEPHGWYCFTAGGTTNPVRLKEPNAWGLYDMSGNVWEWCWDRFQSNYYSISPDVDPLGGTGATRVTRSGNWSGGPGFARVSGRYGDAPEFRSLGLGARIVRTLP